MNDDFLNIENITFHEKYQNIVNSLKDMKEFIDKKELSGVNFMLEVEFHKKHQYLIQLNNELEMFIKTFEKENNNDDNNVNNDNDNNDKNK